MFHLKSLVSYYRDLLFCLYDCFKLRNRDIYDEEGRKILSILFLQKVEWGIRSGSQLPYKQPSQGTLGSVTWNGVRNLCFLASYHTTAFLHRGWTGLIRIESGEEYTQKSQTPQLSSL